jgi:hypothetical protein
MHTPPTNSQENDLETSPRKSPRKGSENHQKGKLGRTQTCLEEPRRIIYTYYEGSYKVLLSQKSHLEALKLVL